MKVFLDVGSNRGQAVSAILRPRYEFDRIYCFEPVPELQQLIVKKYRDPRIVFNEFGLWNQTCEKPIFSPGSQSGSIFADKMNVDPRHSVICNFVRASDWFRDHLTDTDEVYVKLNCEGCEVDIVEDLLDSNEYRKVASLGVTFDVKKIPSQCGREIEIIRRLESCGYGNYMDIETHHGESIEDKIQVWLSMTGADRLSLGTRIRELLFDCQNFRDRVIRYIRRRLIGG